MTILPASDPDQAMSVDEIGIATARHDGLVLRSAFQLVFRLAEGDCLRAVAAESFLRPFRRGMPLPPRPFLASLDPAERAVVERLAVTLHVANHAHLGVEGLDHMLGLGAACGMRPGVSEMLTERLAALPEEAGIDASRLLCGIREPAGFDMAALAGLARDLDTLGVRLVLGGAAGEQPPLEAIRRLSLRIVRIDGAWFRRVVRSDGARRLLASLVEGFRAQGVQVLVEGIETRDQLAAALDAGADLLQGFLLSHPRLAGTALEPAIPLRDILPGRAEVIPLFGGR